MSQPGGAAAAAPAAPVALADAALAAAGAAVSHNLTHQQLWRGVRAIAVPGVAVCAGRPPKKLHPDDADVAEGIDEYVVATYTKGEWSVAQWAHAFASIRAAENLPAEPRRIVMAMVTDDSTVVYYIVHNGLVPPKKN